MKATEIKSLYRKVSFFENQEVFLQGWIRTIRDSKNFGFIEVNDGSFFKNAQIIVDDSLDNFKDILRLPIATAISIKGIVIATPDAKQSFEIKAQEISIDAPSSSDFPLQKKRHTLEYLRIIGHLRPRGNLYNAVFRIRSIASFAIHKFFQEKNFVYVHTPIITASDCEGAGEMFHVTTLDLSSIPQNSDGSVDFAQDFFKKPTNLTVSGQLEGEAFALAYKNIYTFGPTFRSENSNTARHAAEFWMMEPEIAFADLEDYMNLAEEMIKYIIQYVLEHAPEEMHFFQSFVDKNLLERLHNVAFSDFVRIDYTKAVNLLQESGQTFEFPVSWGSDLQTEHERYLAEVLFKKPVFVTDYPKDIKSFYMRLNDDSKTVAAADLLVPGIGEIIGGSQREERYEYLIKRMEELDLKREDYWWYLELRKYGGVKHAGYGLGFDRLIMYLTGVSNIRDVLPFPRTVGSAEF